MKLPYELYTQQRIVDHLENHSPTKFMYSFSRAQRFPSVDRRGFSDSFYVDIYEVCGIFHPSITFRFCIIRFSVNRENIHVHYLFVI